MLYNTVFGAVRIIPASEMRGATSRRFGDEELPSCSATQQPVNASFYMDSVLYGGGGVPSIPDYSHYGDYGLQHPPVGTAGNYRSYPQPQPSPQQYRCSRTMPRPVLPKSRSPRGLSADPPLDQRHYRSSSGPTKKPAPMYRKRREPHRSHTKGTEFSTGPASGFYFGEGPPTHWRDAPPTLGRVHPFYSPSYSTFPPSTMYPMPAPPRDSARKVNQKYPIVLRILLKVVHLALSAAILGLVLGPMRNQTFHDFVIETKTEWQGAVVGVVSFFGILTLVLLLTVCLANKQRYWRQFDGIITGAALILYLLAACLEAFFANCYPPDGWKLRNTSNVCYRAEWIIATILLFIDCIVLLVDVVFIFRTGVNIL
ncbi:hypothetical protein QR680_009410 [Steinernema hermaphroditum]|uniref:MARVEL domain-containing protein n=1 Tax=Steinernema hermaphroditum TaxID=289476 RepID=A0AA39M9T8_9BILA|nr:hypothetical protein QR680_009410 [Steinernema hermaphroditum]